MLLHDQGFEVVLVGRKKKDSIPLPPRAYRTVRMNLFFEKGVAFYAEYNIRLFLFLLFRKKDLLFANDLDTLLPNYILHKITGAKLIYDSHEIFCEVPELIETPFKKKIWEKLEAFIVPQLKYCITVNKSIADWFYNKYKVNFKVIRNIPDVPQVQNLKSRKELGLPDDKKIILLQGAGINIQRGAEEAVEAMQYLNDDCILLIIGGGDVFNTLQKIIHDLHLENKVWIKGKMKPDELIHYTRNADIGITLDKDSNINYHYSLPNKIFDYIHANLPILASPLPEIKAIITHYNIGMLIENHEPKHIASRFKEMLFSPNYHEWKENLKIAAAENNWEKEKQAFVSLEFAVRSSELGG